MLRHILPLLILSVSALVYSPGLSGPYLFDDYSNLLDNRYMRLEQLDIDSVQRAAFSLNAGPLQRPVAMASFAINTYLAGGFESPAAFRVINLAIHLLNGILVYSLLLLVIERYRKIHRTQFELSNRVLSAALAFLWLVHPINLTSVLYIVQRMTSLAALFTLLALISYLCGRLRMESGKLRSGWALFSGAVVFGIVGTLSKESALLLPVFVLVLELILFRQEFPWNRWDALSSRTKWWIMGTLAVLMTSLLFIAVQYAATGYGQRNFTMVERILSESRVLVNYLSLLILPQLGGFGIFHDDIVVSRSLIDPPTTALAILTLIGLMFLAIGLYRRAPLIALGIGWFFAAHLLESTILSLELMHEHRNYLASLGLPFVLAGIMHVRNIPLSRTRQMIIVTAIGVCFAAVTAMRASQWSNAVSLFTAEVRHHPESAAANASLGVTLVKLGRVTEGLISLRRAAELQPYEAGMLINVVIITAKQNAPISRQDLDAIDTRLTTNRASATTVHVLQTASDCVITSCIQLAPHMERWLRILMDDKYADFSNKPYYHQLLGRSLLAQQKFGEAIDAFRAAYVLDPDYLVPLFEIAQIYLAIGQLRYAEIIAGEIRRANELAPLPRHKELRELEIKLSELRRTAR